MPRTDNFPSSNDFIYAYLLLAGERERQHRDMFGLIKDHLHLTDSDCRILTSTGQNTMFKSRIDRARQNLKDAGLIERVEGVARITPRGREFLRTHSAVSPGDIRSLCQLTGDPASSAVATRQQPQQQSRRARDGDDERVVHELLEDAYCELRDCLIARLRERLSRVSPTAFEHIVKDVLVAMGYGRDIPGAARVTPPSHDGGVDCVIYADRLGLDKIYVQAKRQEQNVQRPAIQQFIGALGSDVSKGVFITTSDFADGARQCAEASSKSIVLVGGRQLAQYMIEFGVGVSVRNTYAVKDIDSDYFDEEQ